MKEIKRICLGMIVMSLLFVGLATAQQKEKPTDTRTWTSLSGHAIVAVFVEIKGENLILKDEGGIERIVRLPMLTPADQALAKKLEEQRTKGDAQTKGTSSNLLPVFTAGPAKGFHAIYTHKNFTAKVTNTGLVVIQCLEDGKPVGKPMHVLFHYEYVRDGRLHSRPLTEFTKFSMPTLSATLLEYETEVQDGVTSGVSYAFIDNTIQVWGWVIDPPKLKEPTRLRLDVRFLPSHVFPPEKLVSEQKEELKPYTLVVYPKKGSLSRFPYGNAVLRLPAVAEKMTVEGPVFGNRSVSVSLRSSKNTHILPWIYPDYAPYQGYYAILRKDNYASKSDSERMIVTIN